MRNPILGAAAAALALSASLPAQFDPHLHRAPGDTNPLPLPNFDVRLDADGRVRPEVAAKSSPGPATEALRAIELSELRQAVPGVAVDLHEILGTPHFVRSTLALLSPPATGEAEEVVRAYVERHPGLFEAAAGLVDMARVTRDYRTEHNGVRHLTWGQVEDGLDVFGCELRANLTATNEIVNLSSTLLSAPEGGFLPRPVLISDAEALRIAAASVGIALQGSLEALAGPAGAARARTWRTPAGLRADEAIETSLLLFPRTRADLRSAWRVVVPEIGIGNTYEILVDAQSGEILWRWNRLHFALGGTQSASFKVFTSDSPAPGTPGPATPNGFQFPTVLQQLVTVSPAEVAAASPSHWIPDGANETLGNNVDAHLDLDADNQPDLPRPQGTPSRVFDFTVDTTLDPSNAAYGSGAVTQVFYLANRYHDKLHALGFDEAAGNFQQVNFSGQGAGGDLVRADCQDGSGSNNANWSGQGGDGTGARMQMYVFTGPTPNRDGDLDADIVYHELTHGLSIRLVSGPVSGEQAGGMGEGWSDFVAACLNSEAGDDPSGVYSTGGWTTHQLGGSYVDNYYFGIRRFPYTTDLNKNPQTYADVDPNQQSYPPAIPRNPVIGNTADEVHNVGEVWCVTLWECRANLVVAHGFPAGNDLILQLVVDGLKLTPGQPNFLQARDAILQADLIANGGANLTSLWTAFAKRGMGASATSPGGNTTTGVFEAFDTPNLVLFAYPLGRPEQLAPGVATPLRVTVLGLGNAMPVPGTGQLHYSVRGGPFTTVAMTQLAPNTYEGSLPPLACLDDVRWYVSAATGTGTANDPSNAPADAYEALVYTGVGVVYDDDFENDAGWTPVNLGATSGDWQRGTPVNDPTWQYDPSADGDSSGQCWLTANVAGNSDVDDGAVQLTSSSFDFSSPTASLSYEYYLRLTNTNGADRLLVEIDANGGSGPWTTIATHTSNGGTAWRSNLVTALQVQGLGVTLSANTRLRFTANDADPQSVVEAGVDGILVTQLVCAPPAAPFCFGDGSGAACPCGNLGAPGQGCANSFGQGAALAASGGTSIAADTLSLSASGLPTTAPGLFFQGQDAIAGGAGAAFGDGLRCAGGMVVRLKEQHAAAGVSVYPATGDLPISQQGLVPAAGGTRHYQLWYRNAASFCTADTFNLTNGVRVVWTP